MKSFSQLHVPEFRSVLLRWYDHAKRSLPWRINSDFWRVLVSEFMLQQTRVEAVIPYYERFLKQFPSPREFAEASEAQVLAAWSGLGYYARARNLQQAAVAIANGLPTSTDEVRRLPGVGPYTGAAVGSIALGLPHAVVDGNVLRVVARLTGDVGDITVSATKSRIQFVAQELLDNQRPGDFNQAVMELGATVCLPRNPLCLMCPVSGYCEALKTGRQNELPVKRPKPRPQAAVLKVVLIERDGRFVLRQRSTTERRMPSFWELPELGGLTMDLPSSPSLTFRHTIVNTLYTVEVFRSSAFPTGSEEVQWFSAQELTSIPLTTITKKALAAMGMMSSRRATSAS